MNEWGKSKRADKIEIIYSMFFPIDGLLPNIGNYGVHMNVF